MKINKNIEKKMQAVLVWLVAIILIMYLVATVFHQFTTNKVGANIVNTEQTTEETVQHEHIYIYVDDGAYANKHRVHCDICGDGYYEEHEYVHDGNGGWSCKCGSSKGQ